MPSRNRLKNPKGKGIRFEHEVRKHLQMRGFLSLVGIQENIDRFIKESGGKKYGYVYVIKLK